MHKILTKKEIKFKKDKQLIKVSMNLKQLLISESLISVDILNKVESGRPISGIQTVVQVVSRTSWFIERQVFSADLVSSLKLSLIKESLGISDLKCHIAQSFMLAIVIFDLIWNITKILHSCGLPSSHNYLFWSIVDSAQKSRLAIMSFWTGWTSLCLPQIINSKWSFLEHLISWGNFLAGSLNDPDCPPST